MKLQQDIDFTTLNWVKQELDETLRKSHQALEAYVEDPTDSSQMRFCATYLHQVQGTLRMVELYGAAMVVDEMERVAEGLLDGSVKPQDDTYSLLMRGIVQLPDYLERLQSGHKDIPRRSGKPTPAQRYMSERLLIRSHADGQPSWLVQDTGGWVISGTNAGALAGTLARAQRIVVLVPSEHVVLFEADAVSTRRAVGQGRAVCAGRPVGQPGRGIAFLAAGHDRWRAHRRRRGRSRCCAAGSTH